MTAPTDPIDEQNTDRLEDSEPYQVKARAAEKKLEELFELLRGPAMSIPVCQASPTGPRFRILQLHARGGLGDVFVAFDEELQREVALKGIQERHANNPQARLRFIREAEITGRLEHPGIVPVYAMGQFSDGRPFYAMRLIRGQSFKEAIQSFHLELHHGLLERRLALRKLLSRFLEVCDTVAYAHSRRILHRDLKPENIMLGPFGQTLVLDWGFGKPFQKPGSPTNGDENPIRPWLVRGKITGSKEVLGTPYYMSPEQAATRHDLVGPATDIYGLGATLYCLLAGRAPFNELDLAAVLQKVQIGDFEPPEKHGLMVPMVLAAICKKAMALSPQDRYSTARALADDIEFWLVNEATTNRKEVPRSPEVKKEAIPEHTSRSPIIARSEPTSNAPGWRVWIASLLAIVILATLATVSRKAELRSIFGILTWLGLGIIALFLYLPSQLRLQAEKDRETLAKSGLPKRPNFLRELLVINIVVLPALTVANAIFNPRGLEVSHIMMAWLLLLPATAVVPLGRMLRWRRLARLQASLDRR